MTNPLLCIDNLHIHFQTPYHQVHAVKGVTLHLHQGETLAIVGESGAGKSQLFHAVMGLLPTHARVSGEIQFENSTLLNQPRTLLNQYRGSRMTMVFQDPMTALNPLMRVQDQLMEGLMVHYGASKQSAYDAVLAALQRVRIADPQRCLRSYPHELSGGMRQRVMIAMAIVVRPMLLIADEPTTALDATVQCDIVLLLRDICQQTGMALVLITHDLLLAGGLCERVAVMQNGTLVESGKTVDVFTHPQHTYTKQLLAASQ